jgi:CHASE3 domain sensor protein
MTNAQLYLGVGLPIIAMLTALVVSLAQISGIKGDIADLRGEMRDIRAELREIRSDIKLLIGKVYEMMK